jgi:hypothetical protein
VDPLTFLFRPYPLGNGTNIHGRNRKGQHAYLLRMEEDGEATRAVLEHSKLLLRNVARHDGIGYLADMNQVL